MVPIGVFEHVSQLLSPMRKAVKKFLPVTLGDLLLRLQSTLSLF